MAVRPAETGADAVATLVLELSKLPGVGEKTATRLAYHILRQDPAYAESLAAALLAARRKTGPCSICQSLTEAEPCRICADPGRDAGAICVVERPSDIHPIERSGAFRGRYHVLHGALSPLEGVAPEDLRIRELAARLEGGAVREVILATNPTVEGDATAYYIRGALTPLGVKVTRIAKGIPAGSSLEYANRTIVTDAIEGRRDL